MHLSPFTLFFPSVWLLSHSQTYIVFGLDPMTSGVHASLRKPYLHYAIDMSCTMHSVATVVHGVSLIPSDLSLA
ncbi:hypothetical protein BDR03DRAFT_937166 [Suillus americanus]|nr:hypothetical protein BDR03DRAFT_937166 [Suillus americanus]